MSHSWTYDAPTGVFKNHELSSEIRFAAIQEAKFMQFVSTADGLGKKKGDTMNLTRVSNVAQPTSDILIEGVPMPEDLFSLSTQAVTVYERGRAIPFTSLDADLSYFDIENAIQRKLRDQMTLSMDSAAAAAFKIGKISAIPDGVASITFDTDGTPSTTALANLNYYHIEQIRDYMYSTLNIKPYIDGDYMVAASTKACRGVKSDPKFDDWNKYTNPAAKHNSELGRIESCRFVEINNTTALSGSKGSGSVLGEAVFFGEDPVVMAVAEQPELRAKESGDYGRSKGVAWYGIYGYAQVWGDSATAGEARTVYVTSA